MTILIPGVPVPQGSLKTVNGHTFHDNAAKLKPWREAVGYAFIGQPKVDGPVSIAMSFRLPRPRSRTKLDAEGYFVDRWVTTKPDLDKLCRAVLDALTGIAYTDDAQVAHISAMKSYEDDVAHVGVNISVGPM